MVIKEIKFQIPLTGKCGLRCKFCANSDEVQEKAKTISPLTVIKYIDFALAYGADIIELGVLVGESFLYPIEDFKQILNYCKTKDIKLIQLFTSGVVYNTALINILASKDLNIDITVSVYGNNEESFYNKTGSHQFKNIQKTINYIESKDIKINIFNRSELKLDTEESSIDFKWPVESTQKTIVKNRGGVCHWLLGNLGFDYNGDILGCAWLDMDGTTKLGTINDSVEYIKEQHKKMILLQNNNIFSGICTKCEGYEPIGDKNDIG